MPRKKEANSRTKGLVATRQAQRTAAAAKKNKKHLKTEEKKVKPAA